MRSDSPHSSGSSLVPRLLVRLVTAVCHRPRAVLAVCLACCVISVAAFATQIRFFTQRGDLLSPDRESQRRWRQYLEEFGDDDDMVVVVKGGERERMIAALETVADRLRGQPDAFDRLFYRVDLRPLRNRALLYLPAEQIRPIQENLRSMGLLLELGAFSWQSLTLTSLLTEAGLRSARLTPGQPAAPADEQFLAQLAGICESAAATTRRSEDYKNPWHSLVPARDRQPDLLAEPHYFFSGDGELAFLLVRPKKELDSFTAAEGPVHALRAILDDLRPGFAELEIGLTGLPVLETDEMLASKHDSQFASVLAFVGVCVLYLVVYRGVRCPMLTISTLLVGTAWAMGWMTLTVGHLNILSATFAMMLIGLGDYGVLWVTRYEYERASGAEALDALVRTASGVGPGILTAAVTTSLAFYAAMFADFRAVAELGWIAGSGVLLCALACFTMLPALLMVVDRRAAVAGPPAVLPLAILKPRPWLPAVVSRPRLVVAASLVLTAAFAVLGTGVRYDHNLLNLQAAGLDSVRWEMTLVEHMAGAGWHTLSTTTTPEEALALKERFEKLPTVERVVEVASLVPPDQPRKLEQLADICQRLRRLPERGGVIPHSAPNARALLTLLDTLIERIEPTAPASSSPGLLAMLEKMKALRDRLRDTPPETATARLREFERRLTTDLAENLHLLRDVSTPEPITVADLPPALRERYVGRSGKWLLRVFGKGCLWDYEPLADFVADVRSVDPESTGKPFSTLEGLDAMKQGFERAGLYALLVIVLLLAVDFRNLRCTLLALAPLAIGVILTLGTMRLLDVPLNPANMIALPLVLGVGVDNGVHVLHDYLNHDASRPYALGQTTGRGILVASLTTIFGFGTLMTSSHRGLVGLGLVLTLGVSCCMVAALVVLPALLKLVGGRRHEQQELHTVERRAAA